MEYLEIKKPKLFILGGPQRISSVVSSLIAYSNGEDLDKKPIKKKNPDQENEEAELKWLEFLIINYLSSNDCYNTLDFRAGIIKYLLNKNQKKYKK